MNKIGELIVAIVMLFLVIYVIIKFIKLAIKIFK